MLKAIVLLLAVAVVASKPFNNDKLLVRHKRDAETIMYGNQQSNGHRTMKKAAPMHVAKKSVPAAQTPVSDPIVQQLEQISADQSKQMPIADVADDLEGQAYPDLSDEEIADYVDALNEMNNYYPDYFAEEVAPLLQEELDKEMAENTQQQIAHKKSEEKKTAEKRTPEKKSPLKKSSDKKSDLKKKEASKKATSKKVAAAKKNELKKKENKKTAHKKSPVKKEAMKRMVEPEVVPNFYDPYFYYDPSFNSRKKRSARNAIVKLSSEASMAGAAVSRKKRDVDYDPEELAELRDALERSNDGFSYSEPYRPYLEESYPIMYKRAPTLEVDETPAIPLYYELVDIDGVDGVFIPTAQPMGELLLEQLQENSSKQRAMMEMAELARNLEEKKK